MSAHDKELPTPPGTLPETGGFGNAETQPANERDPRLKELDGLVARENRARKPSKRKRTSKPSNVPLAPTDPARQASLIQSAKECASRMFADLGPFTRNEALQIVAAIRSLVVPKSRAGRKRDERITAALEDWKTGVRGFPLYRKHISGYGSMNRYKREAKARRLQEAIRTRQRRELIDNSSAQQISTPQMTHQKRLRLESDGEESHS